MFLGACSDSADDSGTTDSTSESKDTLNSEVLDTLSYDYFISNFQTVALPITYDSCYLWDGIPFYNESTDEYDFNSGKISITLIDKWILPFTHPENPFAEEIEWHREYLNEDDGWHNVYYGDHFTEGNKDFVTVFVYDKPSESNGAQFYYYFMEFADQECVEVIQLGREGISTSPYSYYDKITDEEMWYRFTTYYSSTITINSGTDITACAKERFEIIGDLLPEYEEKIGQPYIYYDSTGTYLEAYPEKCVEY